MDPKLMSSMSSLFVSNVISYRKKLKIVPRKMNSYQHCKKFNVQSLDLWKIKYGSSTSKVFQDFNDGKPQQVEEDDLTFRFPRNAKNNLRHLIEKLNSIELINIGLREIIFSLVIASFDDIELAQCTFFRSNQGYLMTRDRRFRSRCLPILAQKYQ